MSPMWKSPRASFIAARESSSHPQNLSDGQIRQGLSAMVQLLEHYFSEQGAGQARYTFNAAAGQQ